MPWGNVDEEDEDPAVELFRNVRTDTLDRVQTRREIREAEEDMFSLGSSCDC